MKRQLLFFWSLLVVMVVSSQLPVFADDQVFSYVGSLYHVDESTIPEGQIIVGSSGQIKPKSDSIVAGFEYAFSYRVSDPSVIAIDAKGNWHALKEGKATIQVYGHSRDSSPEFEAELDAHGIQRAEHEPAVAIIPVPHTVEVFQQLNTTVHRLRHRKTGQYVYTFDGDQIDRFQTWGWVDEGIAWTTDQRMGERIYRLYNPGTYTYFFTRHQAEYDKLVAIGWRGEGGAFFSRGQIPIYRFYHAGRHIYVRSEDEKSLLIARGYRYEGVAWYAQN